MRISIKQLDGVGINASIETTKRGQYLHLEPTKPWSQEQMETYEAFCDTMNFREADRIDLGVEIADLKVMNALRALKA